jgi:geranylgeranyl diphosphate synthase type II
MLLHFLRKASRTARQRALALLRRPRHLRDIEEVLWLRSAMTKAGSLEYGRAFARDYCERALRINPSTLPFRVDNDDQRFLVEMLQYVIDRVK